MGQVLPPIATARLILLALVAAGIYFFNGFAVPVLAALVLAFASWPIHSKLRRALGDNRTLAAAVSVICILTFIVLPLAVAITYAVHEVHGWIIWAIEANKSGAPVPLWFAGIPVVGEFLSAHWFEYLSHPGGVSHLVQMISGANAGNIYRGILAAGGGVFHIVLATLFMLFTLFFLYRDGEALIMQVDTIGATILPSRWAMFSRLVPATINSTVIGMSLIALGEGVVLGVAYYLAGAPSPVTLGLITALLAFIPGGAPLSFTLVSIYLAASGSVFAGAALFAWGAIELFIVDKTLRPRLVGGPIKLPFLPTFFGLIGGVKTMGFLGLFLGPVLMALLVTTWREWVRASKENKLGTVAKTES